MATSSSSHSRVNTERTFPPRTTRSARSSTRAPARRRCSPSIEGSVNLRGLSYSRPVSRQAGQEEQMRRRVIGAGLVLALLAVGLVLTTAGSAKPEQAPLKIAWMYPGPHNDGGWSQAHERGRLLVQKTFGDKVETTYKENIFSN